MSIRIGIIMSRDYKFQLLKEFKKKYNLGFFPIFNSYVRSQLLKDEMFLQATISGCDSLTGIGAYDLYNKDISVVYKSIDNKLIAQSVVDEYKERKQNYKEDALKWIEVIKLLKIKYRVDKFGLFWHMCSDGFELERIVFSGRIECHIENISVEFLMKIKPDTIVFFC